MLQLLTRCHHESTGPPLKSFLFDMDDAAFPSLPACYAHHITQAMAYLRETYRGLSFHDRLAILTPSSAFADALRPELAGKALRGRPKREFGAGEGGKPGAAAQARRRAC